MSAYDLLLRGARVVDGTGNPWRRDDVAVTADRIVAVGRLDPYARVVVDAEDRYVAPGFIDIHTHSDIGILQGPSAENTVRQGVTTHVTGNSGGSSAPIAEATRALAEQQFAEYGHPVAHTWSSFAEYLGAVEAAGVG